MMKIDVWRAADDAMIILATRVIIAPNHIATEIYRRGANYLEVVFARVGRVSPHVMLTAAGGSGRESQASGVIMLSGRQEGF